MNLNNFAKEIAKSEGLKKEVDIAQIKEILSIINKKLWGIPYILVKICL